MAKGKWMSVAGGTPKWMTHMAKGEACVTELSEMRKEKLTSGLKSLRRKDKLSESVYSLVMALTEGVAEADLFNRIDSNSDGQITKAEMAAALKSLHVEVSMDQLDQVFKFFDLDGNGRIDSEEFCNTLQDTKEQMPSEFKDRFRNEGGDVHVAAVDEEDPLFGFAIGERAKSLVQLSNKSLSVDRYDEVSSYVKVVAPGRRKGTVIVQTETLTPTVFVMKPQQLSKVGKKHVKSPTRKCILSP
eukprot:TRINITY_DN42379_c0_g1_i1.p1 TRINITY_DN42379_c0_g1~~TRINITY_DN42379_c0_g1_i1.p1  ORF type:complete len:244 (-),score=45.55 TRINITY_DN42379_c0_g1_i1:48-779(-)